MPRPSKLRPSGLCDSVPAPFSPLLSLSLVCRGGDSPPGSRDTLTGSRPQQGPWASTRGRYSPAQVAFDVCFDAAGCEAVETKDEDKVYLYTHLKQQPIW